MRRTWVAAILLMLGGCGGSTTTTVVSTVTSTGFAPASTSAAGTSRTGGPPAGARAGTGAGVTPTVHRSTFRSPSGNIGCILLGGVARCDIRRRSWSPPPRPASCPKEVDFGQGVQLGPTGPGRLVCAGDTTLDPTAPVLAYGTASASGGFTCLSATSGITCRRGGHGFSLSAQRYRVF